MNFKCVMLMLIILPLTVAAETMAAQCASDSSDKDNKEAFKVKLIGIASIFVVGAIGVSVPIIGTRVQLFHPDSRLFLLVKFFAAGVVLATGFVHVLADANESLNNPCLGDDKAWGDFPLDFFVAMVAAVVVMMVENLITYVFKRLRAGERVVDDTNVDTGDEELGDGHLHIHAHASNGHAPVSLEVRLRHRIISQVLEIGIIIHSVIIGISLGVSINPKTIKPLIAALSFHQMFEGMGLGSCITESEFSTSTVATMMTFFSLTTPTGIAIGMEISSVYDENSHTALITQGILNAASAGILIYMALVDLLASQCMKPQVQKSFKLQALAYVSLLLGLGCMSILAIWA